MRKNPHSTRSSLSRVASPNRHSVASQSHHSIASPARHTATPPSRHIITQPMPVPEVRFATPILPRLYRYFHAVPLPWVALWVLIYAVFVTLDIIYSADFAPATVFKYCGIVFCLIYARVRFPSDHLLTIAMAFTLLADTVLVMNSTSIIGVFIFCLAQFFHFARLQNVSPPALIIYFVVVISVFFFGVTQHITPMFIIAAIYAGTLGLNLLASILWYRHTRTVSSYCALVGFILFALCDSCVATSYLSVTSVLPACLYSWANLFAWFFYYPSQIFISNSSKSVVK